MNRSLVVCLAGITALGLSVATQAGKHGKEHAKPHTLLAFHAMYGVDGPFVGEEHAVNGVPGDDLPWVIRRADGRLDTEGHLRIVVRGLVFKDDPSVPEELRGINDEPEFRALVSCLTEIGEEDVELENVATEGFPADEAGNSRIRADLELPDPCVAPVVFILAGGEDKWFAVTGFESEEDEGEE